MDRAAEFSVRRTMQSASGLIARRLIHGYEHRSFHQTVHAIGAAFPFTRAAILTAASAGLTASCTYFRCGTRLVSSASMAASKNFDRPYMPPIKAIGTDRPCQSSLCATLEASAPREPAAVERISRETWSPSSAGSATSGTARGNTESGSLLTGSTEPFQERI